MKISIKIDPSDSKQFTEAASSLVGLFQKVDFSEIFGHIDKLATDFGLAPNTATTSEQPDEASAQQEQVPDSGIQSRGLIRSGEISHKARNRLHLVGILTLHELADYSVDQLMRLSGMRESYIDEYRALLVRHELVLRGDELNV